MSQNKKNKPVVDAAVLEAAARSLDGLRAAQDGAALLQTVADHYRNLSREQLAGLLAENAHATSFSADAAAKALPLRALTGASLGTPTAAADVTVLNGGIPVRGAQLKYHANPTATTFHVAPVKYDGLDRVVPADQLEQVRALAGRRGVDHLGQRNYPAVAEGASDRIRYGGAESAPLTRAEALEAAANPEAFANSLVQGRVATAVKNGAAAGALVGGGISLITNLNAVASGRKSGEDAVVGVLTDTAGCAASGAVVSGLAVGVEGALVRAGLRSAGAAPVAIALTAVDVGKDFGQLLTGDIDGDEFAGRAAGHVVKGGCTWGGMEAGAALGTALCPGVGTIVGGLVGGIFGGLFGGWLTE
jgi:hypothetical protein